MSAQQKPMAVDSTTLISPAAFSAGKFSNRIQHNKKNRHDQQFVTESITSSFILNLNPDHSAQLCRGWRYDFYNDGPSVQNSENIREQLGYEGKWEKKEDWIEVSITQNHGNCEQVGQYSNLVPNHADSWVLRCYPVHIEGIAGLDKRDILLCQLMDGAATFGEGGPHSLKDVVVQGNWIILGAASGVQFKQTNNALLNVDDLEISKPDDAVQPESWKTPF